MAVQLPPFSVLAELLALPPMPAVTMHNLHDPAPDPGIFGPGSATWELFDAPFLVLGGGRALLMQVAHPLVAEGVIDHSDYLGDPFGRLLHTARWAMACVFGTRQEALRATAAVHRRHRPVRGELREAHATARVRGESPYFAKDPQLALWVHATLVDSFLVSRSAFMGPVLPATADRFVREWNEVASLMAVPRELLWQNHSELRAYIAQSIESGPVSPGPGSRRVANSILEGPFPSGPWRQAWRLIKLFTIAELPGDLRQRFGISWTRSQAATYTAVTAALRGQRWIPGAVRRPAILRHARKRCAA